MAPRGMRASVGPGVVAPSFRIGSLQAPRCARSLRPTVRTPKRSTCRHVAPVSAAAVNAPVRTVKYAQAVRESRSQWVRGTVVDAPTHSTVTVSVDAAAIPAGAAPLLHWGLYRGSTDKWYHPEGVTAGEASLTDEATGAKRTPMQLSADGSTYMMEITVPFKLWPISIACDVYYEVDGTGKYVGCATGPHHVFPVGMEPGVPELGATLSSTSMDPAGEVTHTVNFAVFSRDASGMSLCLARARDGKAAGLLEVALDPQVNRSGDIWHISVRGLKDLSTLAWGWRAAGDDAWSASGNRFNAAAVLLDPYASAAQLVTVDDGKSAPTDFFLGRLAALVEAPFDWGETERPDVSVEDSIVVRMDPAAVPGGLSGIAERVPALAAQGVTAVVVPCPLICPPPVTTSAGLELGSAPVSLLAVSGRPSELRGLVKSLHEKGMEAILEVEYGFMADSNPEGTTLSMGGLNAAIYFRSSVLNNGHPIVRSLILHSLRHWATDAQVDGFFFKHAEALVLDRDGVVMDSPALVEDIGGDPMLRDLKLVAAPTDQGLLPRSGRRGFPHTGRWLERGLGFPDVLGRWMGGEPGLAEKLATRLTGSPDLLAAQWDSGLPGNFACGRRTGFVLNSPPPTDDPTSSKSMLVAAVLAQGTPCLDGASLLDGSLSALIATLIDLRRKTADFTQPATFDAIRGFQFHGAQQGSEPDWSKEGAPGFVGYSVHPLDHGDQRSIFVGFNPTLAPIDVALPMPPAGTRWCQMVNTGLAAPEDTAEKELPATPVVMVQLAPKAAIVCMGKAIPDAGVGPGETVDMADMADADPSTN